jgi:putative ABC transport system permease protein
VTSVSAVNHLPLAGDMWAFGVVIEGRPPPRPGEGLVGVYRVCRPGYFETMGASLVHGRDFSAQDQPDGPGVAIINEQFARQQWPDANPVGQRLTLDDPDHNPRWLTIVGVVNDIRQREWFGPAHPEVYLPYSQSPFRTEAEPHHAAMTLVLHSSVDPSLLIKPARAAIWSLNRSVPITNITTMEQVVSGAIWQPRFDFVLTGLFAGLALSLAAMGLYGVISYGVAQRRREFGIRMALGATARNVQTLILRQGVLLVVPGVMLGVAGALALTQVLAGLLYDVAPTDPWTFCGGAVLLLGVALLAASLPARRAARTNPIEALRSE